jgi:hypothetical protein
MAHIVDFVSGVDLPDRAAVNPHCKHDPLQPSLYFIVELVDRHADERSGQFAQQLLEIRRQQRWAASILPVRGARAACVFRLFEASGQKKEPRCFGGKSFGLDMDGKRPASSYVF